MITSTAVLLHNRQTFKAEKIVSIHDVIRSQTYRHAVHCLPKDEMKFQLAENNRDQPEAAIVWLRDPANYPVYLRETVWSFSHRYLIPRDILEHTLDGGPLDHIVAVSILHLDANNLTGCRGYFERRIWWVKQYDAFHGHGVDSHSGWYERGGPCEAVLPQSIKPNWPSVSGVNGDFDRSALKTKPARSHALPPSSAFLLPRQADYCQPVKIVPRAVLTYFSKKVARCRKLGRTVCVVCHPLKGL
jgi:hypothetical protein